MKHFARPPSQFSSIFRVALVGRRPLTDRPPPSSSGPPVPRLPKAGTASVVDPEGAKAAFQPAADENERPTTPPEIAKCVPLFSRFVPVRDARFTDRPGEPPR